MSAEVWDDQAVTLEQAKAAAWAEPGEAIATERHLRRLANMPAEGYLLDLGCGWGRLAIPMARSRPAASVWAVDVSERMLRHLGTAADGQPNLHPVIGDGRALPSMLPMLDGAWSMLVFQHVPRGAQEWYLWDLSRKLRPGAPLVVQFVVGADPGPLSHPVEPSQMVRVCASAGMWAEAVPDPERPTWWWLAAKKKER